MKEIEITTNKVTNVLSGHFHAWGWEVPLYLFLGGLTAGILIIASFMILRKEGKKFDFSTNKLSIWAPVVLSIGMLFLFLDLKHKFFVWRFYTAFEITSPMSWGSWILILIYPLSFLLILGTLKTGYPRIYNFINKMTTRIKCEKIFSSIVDFSEKRKRVVAWVTIPFAISLGIYTGILLSAFGSRPFWNSSLLGPIFLLSGLSAASAFAILLSRDHDERSFLSKVDLTLIIAESFLIILMLIGMASSSLQYKKALDLVIGGELTPSFWIYVFFAGLILPAMLEILDIRGKKIPPAITASLVLLGSLFLRFIIVEAGQISSWLPY